MGLVNATFVSDLIGMCTIFLRMKHGQAPRTCQVCVHFMRFIKKKLVMTTPTSQFYELGAKKACNKNIN
jgi:hypothetical protein